MLACSQRKGERLLQRIFLTDIQEVDEGIINGWQRFATEYETCGLNLRSTEPGL